MLSKLATIKESKQPTPTDDNFPQLPRNGSNMGGHYDRSF